MRKRVTSPSAFMALIQARPVMLQPKTPRAQEQVRPASSRTDWVCLGSDFRQTGLPMRKYAAEFFGTFALVSAGTGAIVINQVSNGAVSHPGIALTFGLVALAMIYTFGDVSGAHFNPAVTIGFWIARRLEGRFVLHRQPMPRGSGRERFIGSVVSQQSIIGCDSAQRPGLAIFRSGSGPHVFPHAGDFERVHGCERKRCHGGHRHRRDDWFGSDVCRPNLRRFNESRAVTCARTGLHPYSVALGLPHCSGSGRGAGGAGMLCLS
jgi:hypothetical protein